MPRLITYQKLLLLTLIGLAAGQRLPPGVNPNLYQQPELNHLKQPREYSYEKKFLVAQHEEAHDQHFHNQQAHYQHFHQQESLDHHQSEQQNLAEKVLTTSNIQLERSHIEEHMPVPMDTRHMSDSELQFHFFKMHDFDDNSKLDGCELYKALIHLHDEGTKHKVVGKRRTLGDHELASLTDPLLESDDTSDDGYIDYAEFIKAREKKKKKRVGK